MNVVPHRSRTHQAPRKALAAVLPRRYVAERRRHGAIITSEEQQVGLRRPPIEYVDSKRRQPRHRRITQVPASIVSPAGEPEKVFVAA